MKKIINGKLYDTETAVKVGEYESSCGRSDSGWYAEGLYQKKTGEFFLYGEGNEASPYSKSCGQNSLCGGESIVPLTISEAKEWAERKLDADEYIAIFGCPDE